MKLFLFHTLKKPSNYHPRVKKARVTTRIGLPEHEDNIFLISSYLRS